MRPGGSGPKPHDTVRSAISPAVCGSTTLPPKETTMRLPPKKAQDIAEVIEHLAKHETIY
jgi:hypothetical protein